MGMLLAQPALDSWAAQDCTGKLPTSRHLRGLESKQNTLKSWNSRKSWTCLKLSWRMHLQRSYLGRWFHLLSAFSPSSYSTYSHLWESLQGSTFVPSSSRRNKVCLHLLSLEGAGSKCKHWIPDYLHWVIVRSMFWNISSAPPRYVCQQSRLAHTCAQGLWCLAAKLGISPWSSSICKE